MNSEQKSDVQLPGHFLITKLLLLYPEKTDTKRSHLFPLQPAGMVFSQLWQHRWERHEGEVRCEADLNHMELSICILSCLSPETVPWERNKYLPFVSFHILKYFYSSLVYPLTKTIYCVLNIVYVLKFKIKEMSILEKDNQSVNTITYLPNVYISTEFETSILEWHCNLTADFSNSYTLTPKFFLIQLCKKFDPLLWPKEILFISLQRFFFYIHFSSFC